MHLYSVSYDFITSNSIKADDKLCFQAQQFSQLHQTNQ